MYALTTSMYLVSFRLAQIVVLRDCSKYYEHIRVFMKDNHGYNELLFCYLLLLSGDVVVFITCQSHGLG